MTQDAAPTHDHFASLAQQAQAVKLAIGVFLASETLLFTAALALVTAYQADWPAAFEVGIHHNTKWLGSINTVILLVSSAIVAVAVEAQRAKRGRLAGGLTFVTVGLGVVFLVIKMTEYAKHFSEGIYPGGHGRFFAEHAERGLAQFWTLYYLLTALHAVHVTVGASVLAWRAYRCFRGSLTHSLEAAALYWHLVDIIWIFLWPLFYLA